MDGFHKLRSINCINTTVFNTIMLDNNSAKLIVIHF